MRKWFIWQWGRGSFQYDVLCALILILIFAIPPDLFNDRHDYERLSDLNEVRHVLDSKGASVYTVKIDQSASKSNFKDLQNKAQKTLKSFLDKESFDIDRVQPIYDTKGVLAAFSFWLDQ